MKQPIDLDKYIADLKARQQQLMEEFDDLTASLEEIGEQLRMAEQVRASFCIHFKMPISCGLIVDEKLRLKYAQLSIKEMLIRIASESDGILSLPEARQTLVRAGVFKDERNAATSMAPVLNRHDDIFRRIGRGIYMVKPQSLIDQTAEVDSECGHSACLAEVQPIAVVRTTPFFGGIQPSHRFLSVPLIGRDGSTGVSESAGE